MAMMDPSFDNPAAQLLGDSELQANGFRVLKELGVGLQGRVDLAVDTCSQIYVALKSPTFETQDFGSDQVDLLNMDCQVQSIIHERDAMRLVEHANVLQYIRSVHGMKNKHSYLVLVMEYASNGDLFDLIGTTGAMADHLAKFYFHQLILGLQACHVSRVIHRDIKPENILFDQNFTLKLCDFGLASIVTGNAEDATLSDVEGTDLYIAPEMAMFSTFRATPVDVWACGVVLFIMLTGYPPFEQPEEGDLWYDHVVRGDMDAFWRAQPASISRPSATAMALINRMMCVDPAKRITISEILAHPWLQDVSSIKEEAVVAQMHVLRRKCLEKAGLLDCDRRKRCSVM
ncbi:hypothetical protein Poli38472_012991 [Pythium oligandrum]|uniref:Protein kinase domain-containing protein n=1 Tax=Pythium oligandrum TaxID=41045 RepID=A0A8K1CJT3_PYTOL|nr:hypothetical protein Poli38472_012991 [Pythium oligandrum]|eukprot:TMW64369.1 hypothetical protein Poli38472_012991 [Pythium oligandrum]